MTKRQLVLASLISIFALIFLLNKDHEHQARSMGAELTSEDTPHSQQNGLKAKNVATREIASVNKLTSKFATSENSIKQKKYQVLFSKLDPSGKWIFNKDKNGSIFSITGGYIKKNITKSGQGLELAREISDSLIDGPHQLVIDSQFDDTYQQNPLSSVFNYNQKVDDYFVYQAYIRFFTKSEDGSVYFINNQLKSVVEPDLTIQFFLADIKKVIEKKYENKVFSFESIDNQPFVFVNTNNTSELAYKSIINITAPLADRREVLISAKTAAVLLDYSYKVQ